MTLSNSDLSQSLWQFSQDYVKYHIENKGHSPICEKDEQWPSPCIKKEYDELHNIWQPILIPESLSFENVEHALELTLHADIKTYYTTLYSDAIYANCDEGGLSLLLPWSADDFARAQENIIGHVMMKRKLKQKLTIFFAITDDEDYILSINNENGEIWVERVGCEPHKKVANSLVEFMQTLTPTLPKES